MIEFPRVLGNITYEYDYYSQNQCLVYFEHILVDDCVRIAFNAQQSRKPLFGYASQYYNTLADGVVIVSGSFWVAFKEAAYIPIILKYLTEARVTVDGDEHFSTPAIGTGDVLVAGTTDSLSLEQGSQAAGEGFETLRQNVEQVVEQAESDDQSLDTARTLTNLLTQLGALSDTEFEGIAEAFEDAIWYGGNRVHDGRGDAFSGNLSVGGETTDGEFLAYRRADQYPPFDILLTFGDINTQAANHTVHRLCDVTITGTEFSEISPTGEPVMQRFDFIARNLM